MDKNTGNWPRRKFVTTLVTAAGTLPLVLTPMAGIAAFAPNPNESLTIQQVIDIILKSIPGAPFEKTVDNIKAGNVNQVVTGIVTTMFATNEVIEKTAAAGANFIIAHEPTFYNHADDTTWLQTDPVYMHKRELLQQHNITVWRCHDYIHAHKPDGIQMGVLQALGWDKYYDATTPYAFTIPTTTLGEIIELVKRKLGIAHVRMMGNKAQNCSRIVLAPGAAGGRLQISTLQKEKPDLLICGELSEWETPEYLRDARHMGIKTGLIVLGHAVSEEPGLRWLQQWLQPQLPGIKITHIPSGGPLLWA